MQKLVVLCKVLEM